MKNNELLTEGRYIDNIILLILANRLLKPFSTWDACKVGIIDNNGNQIREVGKNKDGSYKPSSALSKEKDAWSILNQFLAKVKKALSNKVIAGLAIYYTLLKEKHDKQIVDKQLITESVKKKQKLEETRKQIKDIMLKENITEDEYYSYLVEKMCSDKDLLDG